MDEMHKGRRLMMRALLLPVLSLVLLLDIPQAVAFEGDYVWEARFKASLARARSGHQVKDQYVVGDMYLRGRGTAKNSAKALYWFLLAAKKGHRKAAYKAGYLYLYSNGLSPGASPKQAFPWMRQAALAGYAPAQYELGRLFFSGKIIKRNEPQALKWLGRARAANYAPARKAFDQMVKRMVKTQTAFTDRNRAAK
ncbi:MAG: sel1 repeat family protein [Gammaproteobacteria bacterium]|nr:sel1 repeat family protein [Gammaproteobacteria bacterium]